MQQDCWRKDSIEAANNGSLRNIDGLEKSKFCDFEKLHSRANLKEKIKYFERSKGRKASGNKLVEKRGVPNSQNKKWIVNWIIW